VNKELEIAIQALQEIKDTQKDCEVCSGDCTWCYDGTGYIYKLASEALEKIQYKNPEIDLTNRVFEISIRTWLPQFLNSPDVKARWDEACLKAKECSEILGNLFGQVDCNMEVKAGAKNPCPFHPYNEKEGCPKCQNQS